MIRKTARIDGNKDFEYAKAHLVLIDNILYVEDQIIENGFVFDPLFKITDNFCKYARHKHSDNYVTLLALVTMRNKYLDYYSEVVKAMKVCEITGEDQNDVAGVEGLSITNW